MHKPHPFIVAAQRRLDLRRPAVMGVINVTPDSFSDGGLHFETRAAVDHGLSLIAEGASVIDIGGESTRPGAKQVSIAEEMDRVLPVITALRAQSDVFISVDTSNSEIISEACAAGADMVNDIRALERPGALDAAAKAGVAVCIMHMQGEPQTMQVEPHYDDVVTEVRDYLARRVSACKAAGLTSEQIVVDPGFGFGKNLQHNLALLRSLDEMGVEDCAMLMGVSRKSMFAHLYGTKDMGARITGSLGAAFWAALKGVDIIRCHDVAQTVRMVELACQLDAARQGADERI